MRAKDDIGILLNLAFGAFKARLSAHLAKAGFNDLGASFGYVFRLLAAEPLHLRLVADRLGITPQGALKLIDDMVDKGYVERRDDTSDGRIKRLVLTPRARKAMSAAKTFHRNFERDLAREVGAEAAAGMRLALEAIAAGEHAGAVARPL